MLNKTEVSVYLLGYQTEKIFADYPWVENIDKSGFQRIENKHYFFCIRPFVKSLAYEFFKKNHSTSSQWLYLIICLNMNQEEIDAIARQYPHSLFVNFDESGYTDIETCILEYPHRFNEKLALDFNEKLALDAKAKIPVLNAAMNSLNIPKDLIGYILQFYCCVDKISSPRAFQFFGQQALPRPDYEITTHFLLDVAEAIEDKTHFMLDVAGAIEDTAKNFIDDATKGFNSFLQKFN